MAWFTVIVASIISIFPNPISSCDSLFEQCSCCCCPGLVCVNPGSFGSCIPILPTAAPTDSPTNLPSDYPTLQPSNSPSNTTLSPSFVPTTIPSGYPSDITLSPTFTPTKDPSTEPSNHPTFHPSTEPTIEPTLEPTSEPTMEPTIQPSSTPTSIPTSNPSTFNPTTFAPSTSEPTTYQPTTYQPTTSNPTSSEPSTSNPTIDPSAQPSFSHLTTSGAITSAPTTESPTTLSPSKETDTLFPTQNHIKTTMTYINYTIIIITRDLTKEEIIKIILMTFNLTQNDITPTSTDDGSYSIIMSVSSTVSLDADIVQQQIIEAVVDEYGEDTEISVAVTKPSAHITTASPSSSNPNMVYIYIIIALGTGLCITLSILVCVMYRNKRKDNGETEMATSMKHVLSSSGATSPISTDAAGSTSPVHSEIEIAENKELFRKESGSEDMNEISTDENEDAEDLYVPIHKGTQGENENDPSEILNENDKFQTTAGNQKA